MKTLAGRAALALARLTAVLGGLLFVPAWTLDFWQAWVYLAVFTTSSALITAYLWRKDPQLLERRMRGGPAAEKEKSQKLIQLLASLTFLGLLVVPSLDHRFSWSRVPPPLVIAGNVLTAIGFIAVFRVLRVNPFTAATVGVTPDQRVVSTGPYAVVRHPMYAGALIMLLGTPLALGSWWGELPVILMVIVIARRGVEEEKFLARNLSGYDQYCRRVRYRLLPFVW